MWILETGLLAAAIVHERTLHCLGVVKRGGVKERWWLFRAVHVDAVDLLMLDVEQLELINELPVASQVPVRGSAQLCRLSVGEVGLHVNEGGDAALVLVIPHLTHEGPVEIRLATQQGIGACVA